MGNLQFSVPCVTEGKLPHQCSSCICASGNERTKVIIKEEPICSKFMVALPFFLVNFSFPANNVRRYQIQTNRERGRERPTKYKAIVTFNKFIICGGVTYHTLQYSLPLLGDQCKTDESKYVFAQ